MDFFLLLRKEFQVMAYSLAHSQYHFDNFASLQSAGKSRDGKTKLNIQLGKDTVDV